MGHRVCPWWLGYLLASPLRQLICAPEKALNPYINEGMTALDVGCGMGFFSLPMARLVGRTGKVVCIDLQDKMIGGLIKRAGKAGLQDRIEARVCREDSLALDNISGKVDFALAFAVIHEVPDKDRLFSEIYAAIRQGGRLLMSEPSGHVRKEEFNGSVQIAQASRFEVIDAPQIRRTHTVLFRKGSA